MVVFTRDSSAGTSPTDQAPLSLSTRIATGADSRRGRGRAKGPTILARVRSSREIGTGTTRWRASSPSSTGMFFGGNLETTNAARDSTGTRMGIHTKVVGWTTSSMGREFSNLPMASPTREISGGERNTGRESIPGKMGTRIGDIFRKTAGVG